jgi:ribosomal protein S18 acetylase RimI-like enzyme
MTRARTGALSEAAAAHLSEEGWETAGRLHLLQHDLQRIDRPRPGAFRKGRGAHLGEIAAVDRSAFPTEWQLGRQGLTEALAATPRSRTRIYRQGRAITAFAISGMAGGDGYLQRLAVVEAGRRGGVGRQLTLNALRWMRRRRARRALVNTYEGNDAALGLYEGVGFHELSPGLVVLSIAL